MALYDYYNPGANYGLGEDWAQAGLPSRPEFVTKVRDMVFEGLNPRQTRRRQNELIRDFWGPGGRPAYEAPFGEILADQDPQGTFYRMLGQQLGMPADSSSFGQFARNQYGEIYNAYRAALQRNPLLRFTDFLGRSGAAGLLESRYRMLTPSQRGENAGLWTGQQRWV